MKTADGAHPAPTATTTEVLGPSLILDLNWVAHGAEKAEMRDLHPVLTQLYGDHPDLVDRIPGFWDDGAESYLELQVLGHHAGALELTSVPDVRAAVEPALETVPDDLPLRSETPEARAAVFARLAALRGSRSRRNAYFALLEEVWSYVDGWWQIEGAPAVTRWSAAARHDLERGVDWLQLVNTDCDMMEHHLPEIVERHRAGTPLLLAPCAFFGKGLYLDLPGCMMIGLGNRADLTARARTEQVVRRLRALADPTRLAIFDHLSSGPSSVGEIARAFSLAQPTVSAHVKHLREAGLVSAERRGVRLEVTVDRAASEQLAGELSSLLSR